MHTLKTTFVSFIILISLAVFLQSILERKISLLENIFFVLGHAISTYYLSIFLLFIGFYSINEILKTLLNKYYIKIKKIILKLPEKVTLIVTLILLLGIPGVIVFPTYILIKDQENLAFIRTFDEVLGIAVLLSFLIIIIVELIEAWERKKR